MVAKDTNISQKMRNKSWLSIGKILQNEKKCFIIITRKYFHLENFFFFLELGEVRRQVQETISFDRRFFSQDIMVNFFISWLGLKNSQGRLNWQPSCVVRIHFILVSVILEYERFYILCLISSHPKIQDFYGKISKHFQGNFFSFVFGFLKCASQMVSFGSMSNYDPF